MILRVGWSVLGVLIDPALILKGMLQLLKLIFVQENSYPNQYPFTNKLLILTTHNLS